MEPNDWNNFSPSRMWRDWVAKSEAQWSEAISQLLKNEHTGEALNRQLSEIQIMHRQFSELAQASLATANLPSRSDFEALDERMGRLEDGQAQIAAALSQLRISLETMNSAKNATLSTRPSRTRKPGRPAQNTKG